MISVMSSRVQESSLYKIAPIVNGNCPHIHHHKEKLQARRVNTGEWALIEIVNHQEVKFVAGEKVDVGVIRHALERSES